MLKKGRSFIGHHYFSKMKFVLIIHSILINHQKNLKLRLTSIFEYRPWSLIEMKRRFFMLHFIDIMNIQKLCASSIWSAVGFCKYVFKLKILPFCTKFYNIHHDLFYMWFCILWGRISLLYFFSMVISFLNKCLNKWP